MSRFRVVQGRPLCSWATCSRSTGPKTPRSVQPARQLRDDPSLEPATSGPRTARPWTYESSLWVAYSQPGSHPGPILQRRTGTDRASNIHRFHSRRHSSPDRGTLITGRMPLRRRHRPSARMRRRTLPRRALNSHNATSQMHSGVATSPEFASRAGMTKSPGGNSHQGFSVGLTGFEPATP